MCELLQKYQILIAGCLGFSGVVVTILANGFFSRQQHKRELKSKTDSVRVAILSELEINLSSFEARIEQLSKPINSDAHIPKTLFTDVYDTLLDQVGLLNDNQVSTVIKAYLLIKELPYFFQLYADDSKEGFVIVKTDKRKVIAEMHQIRLEPIKMAISSLKNA
ncbi:hypothetical protein AN394_04184 [Pseudoalteromonas sp. P1-26]|uniref:hypothetical protein n=1 Tax=Pseudoalteromonas sp. P1-26 TaxID=1723759 RepID=UPI0006D65EA6|nr:hypothetical protein [Pseudoalteromonas sp. P1-26]KPZ65998.1 hypothetical protein AN394_04184 [Pseudoalteromonas sp. P1-26]